MNILMPTSGKRYLHIEYIKKARGVDKVISTEVNKYSPALHIADRCYRAPLTASENYLDVIVNICNAENIHAVIPIMDQDVFKISLHRNRFLERDIKLLVHPHQTIEVSMDKYETACLLKKANLPTPETYLLSDLKISDLPFPLILKPRYGHHKHQEKYFFKVIDNQEILKTVLKDLKGHENLFVIQEKLSGTELTIDFFCNADSNLVAVIPGERLQALSPAFSMHGGQISVGKTFKSDDIYEKVKKLTQALHFTGPANIQAYKLPDGKFKITEINPRFTGASIMTKAAGFNIFQASINLLRGKKVRFNPDKFKEITMTCWLKPIYFEKDNVLEELGA